MSFDDEMDAATCDRSRTNAGGSTLWNGHRDKLAPLPRWLVHSWLSAS